MINYTQVSIIYINLCRKWGIFQVKSQIAPCTKGVSVFILYSLAALLYVAVGVYLSVSLTDRRTLKKFPSMAALTVAMLLHAAVLYPSIVTRYGLNFNIFNAISLTALFFLVFFMGFSLYRPILSLGILAAPTAFIGLSAGYFGRAAYEPITGMSGLLQVHILLSFAAYCVLLMACVQAVILKLQIRELKHKTMHRFWVSRLPALQSMESLLFDMILLGFVLLSFALGLGVVATYDVIAQHVAHKLVFSSLSWLVFGWLIFGHYRYGWQGKRAANMTIYGFILLAVGFIGTKAVLELILGRT